MDMSSLEEIANHLISLVLISGFTLIAITVVNVILVKLTGG
jgi:hypothetical protein